MGAAKHIVLRPISAVDANALVKRIHYSHKVVNNSQLHIGVYYQGRLEGALQFGPSLDKRKLMPLVSGTKWHEFIELNRLAFSEALPRNSESRALSIAMKLLRNHAPHLKWVVTFADAAQCGDGTIYRASGFVLTSIKKNTQIWEAPNGDAIFTRMVLTDTRRPLRRKALCLCRVSATKAGNILETGGASMKPFKDAGFKPLPGFQLRYVYFLTPSARESLTVPILPFTVIDDLNARMYRGQKRIGSAESGTGSFQLSGSGANPTSMLHSNTELDK